MNDESGAAPAADRSSPPSVAGRLLEATSRDDPALGELFLLAALPRTFDETMLARLAGKDPEDPAFRAALGRLLDHPLVHERGSGSWTLHGAFRQGLLDHWRAGPVEGFDLPGTLEQLASIYEDRYQAARSAATALEQIHSMLTGVRQGLERYRSFSDTINEQLARAAAELVHVRLQLSSSAAWNAMVTIFGELEGIGKGALCQTLARGWRADRSLVPAEGAALHNAWGEYFDARAANAQRQWDRALEILAAVADPDGIDEFFATWYHGERAKTLRGLYRFPDALKEIEAEIDIHNRSHVDDRNSWSPWLEKAELHKQLFETAEAQRSAEEGHARAEAYAGWSPQIAARLSIVDSALDLGHRPLAARHLIQALWRARRFADEDPGGAAIRANSRVAESALTLLAAGSSRIVNTLTEQMRQLVLEQGADGYIDTLLEQASALGNNGDADGAFQRLEAARDMAEKEMPDRLWDIRLEQAILAADLARPDAGKECVALASDPRAIDNPALRGRCLVAASDGFKAVGAYGDALRHVEQAQDAWREMGHQNVVALTRVMRGDILRCLGDIEGAERELQSVTSFSDPQPQGWLLEFRARLVAAKGDATRAAELAAEAMQIALDLDDRVTAISRGVLTCEFHEKGRAYASLERLQTTVNAWVHDRVGYLSYQLTHDAELADEHAARAVRVLVAGLGPSAGRRRSARDHLEEAIRLDDKVWWYHLEMGLLDALGGRQAQARQHVRTAMRRTSDADVRTAMEDLLTDL